MAKVPGIKMKSPSQLNFFFEKCDAEWWITRKYWSVLMRFLQST